MDGQQHADLNDDIFRRAKEAIPTEPEGSRCPYCGALPASAGNGSGPWDTWFWAPGEARDHMSECPGVSGGDE